jgi:hypothetical protein
VLRFASRHNVLRHVATQRLYIPAEGNGIANASRRDAAHRTATRRLYVPVEGGSCQYSILLACRSNHLAQNRKPLGAVYRICSSRARGQSRLAFL